jgi:transposase
MEACGGAHYWSRKFKQYGHEVKLISPQFVKPFVKGNKNDYQDAEAIVEASSRPSMRYVSPKTIEQQDMQGLLRMRESCMVMRTQLVNQLRGLLIEYGITAPKGLSHIRKLLAELLGKEAREVGISLFFKELLRQQYELFQTLDKQIKAFDKEVDSVVKREAACQDVEKIPGVGPVSALALVSSIGDPNDFKNGRHFSAFLGLVPKQHSSGGKSRLLGISKRGNSYVRQVLIHGARAVIAKAHNKTDAMSRWVMQVEARRGRNCAVVALANKNARIALSLLKHQSDYKKAS